MILLGIAAIVLIQNTIRLSIFSRRREIEVMKLVGRHQLRSCALPFMLEGMLTGLVGAVGGGALLDGRVHRAERAQRRVDRSRCRLGAGCPR